MNETAVKSAGLIAYERAMRRRQCLRLQLRYCS